MNTFLKITLVSTIMAAFTTSFAADLSKIQEIKKSAVYYRSLTIELASDTDKLLGKVGCESHEFNIKFRNAFDKMKIPYHLEGYPQVTQTLEVARCSTDDYAISRLNALVKYYEIEAQARTELYNNVLKAASLSNPEARALLIQNEKESAQAIKNLEVEIEKAKKVESSDKLKRTLMKTLYVVGAIALVAGAVLSGGTILALIIGVGASSSGTGITLLLGLGLMAGGHPLKHSNANKLDLAEKNKIALEKLQLQVDARKNVLKDAQLYREAIKDLDESVRIRLN